MAWTGRYAFNEIMVEPLTKENHVAWFAWVKNYLIARELWEVIDGSFEKPSEEDEDYEQDFVRWRRMNAAALHAIQISCTPKSLYLIVQDSEAKVAWDVLNLIYNYNALAQPLSPPQEPLTMENRKTWFEWVRNYLIAQDLWEVIDGTFERPHEEDEHHKEDFERWTRKNAASLDVIQTSCPVSFSDIRGVSEAKEAWHIVIRTYNKPLSQPLVPPRVMGVHVDFDVGDFYKAIRDNNWGAAKAFIDEHPCALNAILNLAGDTALHVAAMHGHEAIVKELVALVPPQYLEIVNVGGVTPLLRAAEYGGDLAQVLECMVNKNSNILGISYRDLLPVALAFGNAHKETGRFLYSVTPLECLKPERGTQGSKLLFWCFAAGDLDVALDLLERCPELLFAETKGDEWTPDGWTPVLGIASMPSAFSNESKLMFWRRWIYHYIHIRSTPSINFVRLDIQQQGQIKKAPVLDLVQRIISHAYTFLGMKEMYEVKLLHAQAAQILGLLCKTVPAFHMYTNEHGIVADALFLAAKEGIVEFVAKVIEANPLLVFSTDSTGRHMFFYAVEYRQAKVFNLIHETRIKNTLSARIDRLSGNTMLHTVGMLAPSSRLNRISGSALQMQSELQWFKEVESVVPPGFRVRENKDGKKAKDIFKDSHSELRKEGEKWMKETSSSCSVVGALIVTMMFATAFTVPGGNNQDHGYPIFLEDKLFLLFIISDALSLFSSTTSVLMFLGVLTSRYAEEDFLISLPRKLIIGLATLFFSIATMMVAFSACILIMLLHTYPWALLPVIMLASVPVTLFALLQFPLLVRIISSTYGPCMFKKKVKLD